MTTQYVIRPSTAFRHTGVVGEDGSSALSPNNYWRPQTVTAGRTLWPSTPLCTSSRLQHTATCRKRTARTLRPSGSRLERRGLLGGCSPFFLHEKETEERTWAWATLLPKCSKTCSGRLEPMGWRWTRAPGRARATARGRKAWLSMQSEPARTQSKRKRACSIRAILADSPRSGAPAVQNSNSTLSPPVYRLPVSGFLQIMLAVRLLS